MNYILLTLFLIILVIRGGGSITFLLSLQLLFGSIVTLAWGFAFFSLAKFKSLPCKELLYFITGTLISGLFTYFISSFANISAGYAYLILSITVLSYLLITQPQSFYKNIITLHQPKIDQLVFLCLMGFSLLWCWQIAGSFPNLLNQGFLSTWIDAYYHGAQIAQFSDMKAVGQGDIFLAGVKPFSYHRAIYMLPAVISQVAQLPGIAALTAILIPMGFLLLASTIYCVGTQIAKSKLIGLLTVIFLLVFPDNSWLGLKNGFLGFLYVVQVAPGTSYGLAGCLVSIYFYMDWLRNKSAQAAISSLVFAFAVYFFRAHFFVLYFPALITAMLTALFIDKKYFWPLTACLAIVTLLSAWVLLASKSAVFSFLHLVHLDRGGTLYTDFYQYITNLNQPFLTIPIGLFLLISGIVGMWSVLYPILLLIKTRRFGFEMIDYFPLILLFSYIGIVLFAPAIYQTPDELQHRPSGLLYAVFIIFSVFYATKILEQSKGKAFSIFSQSIFVGVVSIGVILTSLKPSNYPMHVLFRGYSLYQDYQKPLNPDLVKVAMFLRDKAIPGDVFVTSKDDTDPVNVDTAVVVSSISGLPSYLGEQTVQSLRAEPARLLIIKYRDSSVRQSIVNATSKEEAFKLLRANRISWYIALSAPSWDKDAKHSTLKNDSMAVYHIL